MIESCITFLPVSNLEKTVQFYTEVVGLTVWKLCHLRLREGVLGILPIQ